MSEQENSVGMLTRVERKGGELSISASSSKSKAEVEARYVIALQRPRSIEDARIAILSACKRPRFAEGARYRKPVGGGKTVDGLSIRFAEEALKDMKNIFTDSVIVWEDDQKRTLRISVTDLESNLTYSDEIVISKTVERSTLKEGQESLGERTNSYGKKVYIVAATEDDMSNKSNSAKSKAIRNSGLRLIPQDILEEAEETIIATLSKGGGDPKLETKRICDAFAGIGIKPSELERLLGHSLESISPKELVDLRATYSAIKDEETTWAAVIAQAEPKKPAKTGPDDTTTPAAGESAVKQVRTAADIKEPLKELVALAKDEGCSEAQVHAFMKSKGLAGQKTEELMQCSDANMRTVILTWPSIVGAIKAINKVE